MSRDWCNPTEDLVIVDWSVRECQKCNSNLKLLLMHTKCSTALFCDCYNATLGGFLLESFHTLSSIGPFARYRVTRFKNLLTALINTFHCFPNTPPPSNAIAPKKCVLTFATTLLLQQLFFFCFYYEEEDVECTPKPSRTSRTNDFFKTKSKAKIYKHYIPDEIDYHSRRPDGACRFSVGFMPKRVQRSRNLRLERPMLMLPQLGRQ